MANTIAIRIADFLQHHPPFNLFNRQEVEALSRKMLVRYYEKGDIVFKTGGDPSSFFFVVKEGAVGLEREENEEITIVDLCDEGDIFGLRPLIAGDTYRLTARAAENSLLYLIPTAVFQPIMESKPQVALYLASLFASDAQVRRSSHLLEKKLKPGYPGNVIGNDNLSEIQLFEDLKTPVTCPPDMSIKLAAEKMTLQDVGSIIVVDNQFWPIGILTDTDLRKKVATGDYSLNEKISTLMSSPVLTIAPGYTVAEVQILMIEHNVHHLCVTEDGSTRSSVKGIISEHDLLVVQGNSPAILVREIRKAKDTLYIKRLREKAELLLGQYLRQEVAISFISRVMAEMNDAVIHQCIALSLAALKAEGLSYDPHSFCWLSLGSEGRKEQLLRTDQDNALVFEDPAAEVLEEERLKYLKLAKMVTAKLNEVGFVFCPADMMASNPKWCLSLSEWKKQFGKWIFQPGEQEVMYSTIFFDYRPVYGNAELAKKMTEGIFHDISKREIFLSFMAKNALLNPPPLSFFRNFMVERNGEHKDEFDIKARAMMPLTDAARVLILHARFGHVNNTIERFQKLAALEPANAEIYDLAADAYEILMRFRALQGLQHQDTGRFIKPELLNKMDRMLLKNAFKAIHELQKILRTRFQTSFMM